MKRADIFRVHNAIHAGEDEVELSHGEKLPVLIGKNQCRVVHFKGWDFMEQNKLKNSNFAKEARAGKRLTWLMNTTNMRAKWGLVREDKIQQKCGLIVEDEDGDATMGDASAKKEEPETKKRSAAWVRQKAADVEKKSVHARSESKSAESSSSDEEADVVVVKKQKKEVKLTRTLVITVEFPKSWCNPFNKVQRIELKSVDAEWKMVAKLMQDTCTPVHKERYSYSGLKVSRICRVQNPDLWNHYYLRKKEVKDNNRNAPEEVRGVLTPLIDRTANEYYFFHGSHTKIAEKISEVGFDERESNLAGMFGCGIYFAENSSKSAIYSHSKDCAQVGAIYAGQQNACNCTGVNTVERVMFLCRVCIGTPWVRVEATDKAKPLRRPPDRELPLPAYDSVLGESSTHNNTAKLAYREFIVYDRRQCYPEYMIYFSCKK